MSPSARAPAATRRSATAHRETSSGRVRDGESLTAVPQGTSFTASHPKSQAQLSMTAPLTAAGIQHFHGTWSRTEAKEAGRALDRNTHTARS